MISSVLRAKHIGVACIAAWALVACGGGGGKDTGSVTGATSSNATPSTGLATQDVTAPTLTNNVATDGRAWLNYRRSQAGMSVLADNTKIDAAAQGHSDYQRLNNTVTHVQTAGKQGFTGATLNDRFRAAGYIVGGNSNAIGEVIAANTGTSPSGFYMAEQLITAIYHRFVIFEPVFKEIGSGSALASTSSSYTYFTTDFAANNGYGPGLSSGTLAIWPFNGQVSVPVDFYSDNEEPDPVPNANQVGYPISVHANLSSKLLVTSFTVSVHGSATPLTTRLLSQATDSNMADNGSAAAIIPLSPLAAGTTYDVTFTGTLDGAAVNRSWSFTTAK